MNKTEYPFYYPEENIVLKVDFTAEKAAERLAFRIVLQTFDKIRVAMATTDANITVNKGGNFTVLELPIKWLAPGKYSCFIVAYSVNEFGTDQVHDRIEDACAFEIQTEDNKINNMSWNHNAWGHLKIPTLRILK